MEQKAGEKVLALFKECHAVLEGHFLLTSGKHSARYFDKIRLIEKPDVLERIVDFLVEKIRRDQVAFDYVVSPAYGAIAIGFLVALKLKKRFAFTQRVEEKMAFRPGWAGLQSGQRAIIVEDVLTTGGSIMEVIEALRQKGISVAGVYVLVDRTAGEVLIEGQQVRSLVAFKVEAYEPEACPLCLEGVPLVKPGASDKKV